MIDACSPVAGPPSLARDLLANTDCFIAGRVEAGFGQLLAPGGGLGTALTIGLTIYVAFYGYRLALGRTALSLGDLVPRLAIIGLMLALVTNWAAYQRVVFNLIFDGPQAVARLVMPRSGSGSPDNVIVSMQSLFDAMTDYAGKAWEQPPPKPKATSTLPPAPVAPATTPPNPAGEGTAPVDQAVPTLSGPSPSIAGASPFALGPAQFVAAVLWASALLMMASSVGLLLVVRIVLALLLIFGPVFIALAIFSPTRGLFEGWLRATVKFALVPLIVLPLAAVLVAILPRFVAALPELPIVAFRDTPALAILMTVLVFAVVLAQALSLAGLIAGAIRLPRRSAASALPDAPILPPRPLADVAPSRSEAIAAIVQAPPMGGGSSTRSGALVTANMVETPMVRTVAAAEYAGRLGQDGRNPPRRTGFVTDLHPLIK